MKTIQYKDERLTLLQDAYFSVHSKLGYHYRGVAVDQAGNRYLIIWEIINMAEEDEGLVCDWTKYRVIALSK